MDYEFWLDLAEEYDWHRIDRVIAADRNHPERKIIRNADASLADTAALREERGINRDLQFRFFQTLDKIDLRWRRISALPYMFELLSASPKSFAFPLQRRSVPATLRTQLLGDKKEL